MNVSSPSCSSDTLSDRLETCGVSPNVQEYIRRCVEFHTFPAPGILIGAFMVDYALELIEANPNEKLYAACETPKCVPDALQVIIHTTIGNSRLKIIPIGKFAITVNRLSADTTAEAVRVFLDREKVKKYPIIDLWYANSPQYVKATMRDALEEEILRSGRDILSSERVRVMVKPKKKWESIVCPCCGESVPDYMIEGDHCGTCGSMKYYEKTGE
jgi:formylmethanofuran dehydrogenase subunit E